MKFVKTSKKNLCFKAMIILLVVILLPFNVWATTDVHSQPSNNYELKIIQLSEFDSVNVMSDDEGQSHDVEVLDNTSDEELNETLSEDISTEDSSTEDISTEDNSIEDNSTEDDSIEDISAEDNSTEDILAEEILLDEALTGETLENGSEPKLSNPIRPSLLPTGTININWIPNNGTSLDITPAQNVQQSARMKLDFSLGGTEVSAPAYSIQIRIPLVFYNRSGLPINNIDMSLPSQSTILAGGGGDNSYCYDIDSVSNEIVIMNYKDVSGTGVSFSCEMSWLFNPYQVKDGYNKADIQAGYKIDTDLDGMSELEGSSNVLEVVVHTTAKLSTLTKTLNSKYEKWLSDWGAAPDDASDFFYLIWNVRYNWSSTCTQPYTVTVTDIPGQNGTVVAYKEVRDSKMKPVSGESDFQFTMTFDNPATVLYSDSYYSYQIVIKYPRSALNDTTTFTNSAAAILKGIDDAHDEKSANSSYAYQSVDFNYPGDLYKVVKGILSSIAVKSQYSYGSINRLENGEPAYCTDLSTDTLLFLLNASVRGWSLTNEGTENYTTELIDDQVYMNNRLLSPSDYNLNYFSLRYTEYDYIIDPNKGYTAVASTDYLNYHLVKVYYKTESNPVWELAGEAVKTGSNSYNYTDLTGSGPQTNTVTDKQRISLPAGTYAVKFVHTGNRFQTDIYANIGIVFYPTDYIKSCVTGRSSVAATNIDTLKVTNKDGQIVNGENMNSITGTLKTRISEYDNQEYGKILTHDYATINLERLSSHTAITKTAGNATNNASEQYAVIPYTVEMYERGNLATDVFSPDEAIKLEGFVRQQQNGTFYDLLPYGARIEPTSVRARTYMGTPRVCTCEVEFADNWQGSGRTMMMVHVTAPDKNYLFSGTYLYSGFTLYYDLIYPWQSCTLYGSTLTNSLAYRHVEGGLSSGTLSAIGSALYDNAEQYFTDLNNDGIADDGNKDTVYTNRSKSFVINTSAETGFNKKVKASDRTLYGNSTEVSATGTYTYRLYFGNSSEGTAKGLIFYDILEAYESGETQWKGILKNIDVSYAVSKGIKPVIYYSTVNMTDGATEADNNLADYGNLSDTLIWSATPPVDIRKVTAIAVDLRKKVDGSDYTMNKNETVFCFITMEAPPNYEDYISPTVYAWNRAYYTITSIPDTGTEATFTEECNFVKVSLRKPDVDIQKISDPESGTQINPQLIQDGDSLKYTVTVTNINMFETMMGIEVTDTLPNGFTVDVNNILCYFGTSASAAERVNGSSRVNVTKNGQLLVFTVDKLIPGEKINFVIPGEVTSDNAGLLANTAVITALNGYDVEISSNTTYHQPNMAVISMTGTKTLAGKELTDNMFNFTVQDANGNVVATGTNMADGTITFSGIAITEPGDYFWFISEENDGSGGIIYDSNEYSALWRVTTNPDGTLKAEMIDQQGGEFVFNNRYMAESTSISLTASKKLNGKELTDNMFSFAIMDESNNVVAAGTNKSDGTITFGEIEFNEPGIYTYTVSEINGGASGIAYDEAEYTVTVNVVDNGDGTMTATASYPAGGIAFDNSYSVKSTTVSLIGTKNLTGKELTDNMFSFAVKDINNNLVAAGSNKSDGMIKFGEIGFDKPGIYTYYVSEINGDASGVAYDETEYIVTVEAVDYGDGTMTATVIYPTGGIVYSNSYTVDSDGSDGSDSSDLDYPKPPKPPKPTPNTPYIPNKPNTPYIPDTTIPYKKPLLAEKTTDTPEIIITTEEQIPLGITNPDNNGLTAIKTDNPNEYIIVGENSTPLGVLAVPEGTEIDDVNIIENLTPLGIDVIEKQNPKTGYKSSPVFSILHILAACIMLAVVAYRKKAAKKMSS